MSAQSNTGASPNISPNPKADPNSTATNASPNINPSTPTKANPNTSAISNPALKELAQRGLIQQASNLEELNKRMNEAPITFYIGIDPTAPSLHLGSLVPIFATAHLAQAGHRAIILIGTGTALIGDPSGKTEMRKMLSPQDIQANATAIQSQLESFFARRHCTAQFMQNSDWLLPLRYIEFLRDIGRHFSVNRMLGFEAYKQRLERGLSFIEFNYQLLQSYDFLELYRRAGCQLQIGGDDQWGNIVAGVDLIRRVEGNKAGAQALTFPLMTLSNGKKMGKTEKGSVFIAPELTSAFDFYQYLRNTPDSDVEKFLKLFSFRSLGEIEALCANAGNAASINATKDALAYELTSFFHGHEKTVEIRKGLRAMFGSVGVEMSAGAGLGESMSGTSPNQASRSEQAALNIPTVELSASELLATRPNKASSEAANKAGSKTDSEAATGIPITELFQRSGLCASKSEARRLIQQGGARVNNEKISNVDAIYTVEDFPNNTLVLQAGKKRYARIIIAQ